MPCSPSVLFVLLVLMLLCVSRCMKINKIVGGSLCSIEQIPNLVALKKGQWDDVKGSYEGEHMCGGSILSETWVLTAAHCFLSIEPWEPMYVTAGRTCESDTSSPQFQVSEVKQYVLYPGFSEAKMTGDLALVELKTRIVESRFVKYANLSDQVEDSWLWDNCNSSLTAGWGEQNALHPEDKTPLNKELVSENPCLQCVDLDVVPTPQCARLHSNHIKRGARPFADGFSNILCAWKDGKDTCVGDSGGPLMCSGLQIGIISVGVGCAFGFIPSIYTRVDFYYDFIQDVMCDADCKENKRDHQ